MSLSYQRTTYFNGGGGNEKLRLVCLSDTHNNLSEIVVPDGDVLIFAGDISMGGRERELIAFNTDLVRVKDRFKKIILIAGNHDFMFQTNHYNAKRLVPNATYLEDSEVIIDGVKLYGSPWQPWFHDWAFNLQRGQEIKKKWDMIPKDTDVLITHGPPYNILDETPRGEKVGCQDLFDAVMRIKPKVHVFGHIHWSYGEKYFNGTHFVNASSCTERYEPTNAPIVVDI